MPERKPLRAVSAGERPASPLSLTEASAGGPYRSFLEAMCRETAAAAQAEANGTAKAALLRRLHEARKELESLGADEEQEAGRRDSTGDEAWTAI